MRRITQLLITATLLLIGVGSVNAGKYYATISVANDATWDSGTSTMSFTAVNGWQILLTGLPSGDITEYTKFHTTLSSMSDNISNIRLCIKDTDGTQAWHNLFSGENNVNLAKLAADNPDCDFSHIADITLWSPSSAAAGKTVNSEHPASVKITNVYLQKPTDIVINNGLKDEITTLDYITGGNKFVISDNGTNAKYFFTNNENENAAVANVPAASYFYFTLEKYTGDAVSGDNVYKIKITNAAGEGYPRGTSGGYYLNAILNYNNAVISGPEAGWSNVGNEIKDALWYVNYDADNGFSFQNVYRIDNNASSWLSLEKNFKSDQQYLKLYKSIDINVNTELDVKANENVAITVGGENRNFQLYVPDNYQESCPLVLSLHGAGGASTNYTPFKKEVADAEGCIVAYPQGKITSFPIGFGGDRTGWTATGEDNFDVDFLKAIIEDVASKYSIDRKRIYCCGFSNGGMMTYAMANACSDEIAAFASISGYPLNEFHLRHTGSRPVPFMHIHGKEDGFVLYSKMPTIVDEMVARLGANPVPTTTTGNGYTKNVYAAGDGSFPYVYYEIDGMGHNDYTANTEDGNSAQTMWNFFKNYTLDSQCDKTLKWAPRIETTNYVPAEHGWTVNSGTTLLQFGGDQSTNENQNVYHSLQFDNGNYKLCFKSTGAAGKTIGVKIEKLTGSKVVLSTTVNVGEEAELPFEITDGWGEYKLTMTRLSESDNITVSDITIKQTEDTPSKYIQLGSVLTLSEAVAASANGEGFAIVYNGTNLLTNKTSGDPKMSLEDISNVNRGYLFKLTARASVDDVQYYRLECFNPDNTLIAAGTDAGAYGDNILSPVSWGDIWSSANVGKNETESGDGNTYTAEEWDGRDFKYAAQWCFESDGNGGYYIKTRAVGSQNPYISGSGGMTNESGKASFKFYSLDSKSFATLNFNSAGVAHINLSDLQLSSGLTYDPATGILTSATGNEDLYLLFDNEDFSGVTKIEVARTTTGTENEIEYSDIINTLDIYDATSNNTLHTWYSSKYGVSDFQNYNPGRVNKIRWHITHAGTMKLTGITITGKVVNGAAPGWTDVTTAMYNTSAVLHLNQDAACVYGKENGFTADDYADISAYKKLKLTGVAGTTVRVYINSASAQYYTLDSKGDLIIDFKTDENYKNANYLHLVNIRASAYNTTANISSVQLYHDDYVLNGCGRILASAQSILDNAEVTNINATGITAATELTTANPNCLIFANVGMVTNANNVIIDGTCASLVLTDGYPFKAPSDFTATAATYTTTISAAAQAGTLCLPYAAAIPEGVTAYTLTYQSGDNATATEVETTIPANTPVLLNGSGEVTFTGSGAVSASASNVSGALKGVFVSGTVPEGSYVLQKKDNKLAFFKVGSTTINIKPFRAYLTAQAGARLGITFADETTGIETLDNLTISPVDHSVYNLKGQRIGQPTKGLYIVNGKKVVIK